MIARIRAGLYLPVGVVFAIQGVDALAQRADAVLDEVVVTATQREQSIHDVPAAATVVRSEEIQSRGAENVLDAISGTTGVTTFGRSFGGRQTLSLRGMDSVHTLFLIDGLRVTATDDWVGHSDYQFDWVPVDGIERIEVVRGPMSVLYGSDAMGGVVNVITRRPGAEWTGRARFGGRWADGGAGGGDSGSGGFNASGAIGDQLRVAVSGSRLHKTPLRSEEDRNLSEIEGRDVSAGNVLLSWQPLAGHTFDIEHRANVEDRVHNRLSGSTYYRDSYRIERSQSVATWRANWDQVTTMLRAWETDFSVENDRSSGIDPTHKQSMNEKAVDGRAGFGIGAMQYLTVGFDARTETMKHPGFPRGEKDADFRAGYVQDELTLNERWLLTLGVRYDHHSVFGGETSPRAYLVWLLDEHWRVRGGYGEGFRAPTLKQSSSVYSTSAGPHTFVGNDDLQPETSRSYEIGVVYADRVIDWEATAFHNKVRDLITTRQIDQQGSRRVYIYDNVNAATIKGLESAVKVNLPKGWYVSGNFQWLETEDEATGRPLNGRAARVANGVVGWKQDRWGVNMRLEHTGKQRIYDQYTPAYNLINAGLNYDINTNLQLTAGFDNLTNVRLADKSDRFDYSIAPRTFRLSLVGTF